MDMNLYLAIALVLMAVVVAVYSIRSYGAGYGARSVVCPKTLKRASISTCWTTRGGESTCDVVQCSEMLGGQPVTCEKDCLAKL